MAWLIRNRQVYAIIIRFLWITVYKVLVSLRLFVRMFKKTHQTLAVDFLLEGILVLLIQTWRQENNYAANIKPCRSRLSKEVYLKCVLEILPNFSIMIERKWRPSQISAVCPVLNTFPNFNRRSMSVINECKCLILNLHMNDLTDSVHFMSFGNSLLPLDHYLVKCICP